MGYSWRPEALASRLTAWISVLKKSVSLERDLQETSCLYSTITTGALYCEREALCSVSYVRNLTM